MNESVTTRLARVSKMVKIQRFLFGILPVVSLWYKVCMTSHQARVRIEQYFGEAVAIVCPDAGVFLGRRPALCNVKRTTSPSEFMWKLSYELLFV